MALRRICDLRGVLRPARLAAPVKASASPKPSPLAAARRWFTSSTPARAPGPIARFNAQYSEWLEKYPLTTKIITSAAIGAAGDIGCQLFIEDRAFDFVRLAQFTALNGLLVGPSLHVWYGFLFRTIPGTTIGPVLQRVALDQLGFAPLFIALVFATISVFQGARTVDEIKDRLKAGWAGAVMTNYKIWPAAQMANFYFIPLQHQVLFANVVGLFWNTYMSWATSSQRLKKDQSTTTA